MAYGHPLVADVGAVAELAGVGMLEEAGDANGDPATRGDGDSDAMGEGLGASPQAATSIMPTIVVATRASDGSISLALRTPFSPETPECPQLRRQERVGVPTATGPTSSARVAQRGGLPSSSSMTVRPSLRNAPSRHAARIASAVPATTIVEIALISGVTPNFTLL